MKLVVIALWLCGLTDSSPLSLADLPAVQGALADTALDAPLVQFRDLWNQPSPYAGRRVRISGTVQRSFRQGEVGEFPPLVETWIADPSRNLFCLVLPDTPGLPTSGEVEFVGTYLRTIRYKAGDADRLAPLIVGAGPLQSRGVRTSVPATFDRGKLDILAAVIVGFMALMLIARRMLDRPLPPNDPVGPTPEFIS